MNDGIIGGFFIFWAILAVFSFSAHADSHIARFVFITEPQEIQTEKISGTLTLQAQDAGGNPVKVGVTLCLGLVSSSAMGAFSSNNDNWKPIEVLTINSNWTSRTFYYKSSDEGSHTLKADIAVKPEDSTCTAWPKDEWATGWSVQQTIIVGGEQSVESSGVQEGVIAKSFSSPAGGVAAPFKPAFTAYAGEDQTVVTGSLVEFVGIAFGPNNTPFEASRYWWNFGDGAAKEGRNVSYIFSHVGTYTVGLHVSSGSSSASDYVTVQVVPNQIAVKNVVMGDGGFVRLENPSEYVIDIGGWHISDAVGSTFTLMPKTKIHAYSDIALSNRVTGLLRVGAPMVVVYYPNGVKVFEYALPKLAVSVPATAVRPSVPLLVEKTVVEINSKESDVTTVDGSIEGLAQNKNSAAELAQVSVAPPTSSKFFFLTALGVSILAAGGFLVLKKIKM